MTVGGRMGEDPASNWIPPEHLDWSVICGHCYHPMRPEHAHYRCHNCGERDSCCEGGWQAREG
jgi:hypothetical protein